MLIMRHRSARRAEVAAGARPERTVVVGLDGAMGTADLVRVATALAQVTGARCELVHVLDSAAARPRALTVEDARTEARAMLDGLCDANGPATTGRLVESGDPARRVAAVAESAGADLIVVGTRHSELRPDTRLGSVSSRLAADAPCPVLVVPFTQHPHVRPDTWTGRTIVCGYDGSAGADRAARAALALAGRLEGGVRLVSVENAVDWRLDEVAARLRRDAAPAATPIEAEVRGGDPGWELERVARALTAPVIAVGSRGLGPWDHPLLGSVARHVLFAARRPVLVAPATCDPAGEDSL